ncbi:hypothetical protein AB0L47_20440 [Streptomyces bobili]|uniref:hypothetical protein n=1 Tax=Streptomyces bobili TaxID=67280 RepID=UPI00341F0BD8
MKRDPLLWAALAAVLVVLASAEYGLAVAWKQQFEAATGVTRIGTHGRRPQAR